jgi:hypothetical protein
MEMFNKSVAKDRIGPLKKSSTLDPLREVERYFLKQIKKYKLETSYDVLAQEIPYFKTMAYTEYATCFMMHPLNLDLRLTQIMEASEDEDSPNLDFAAYFASNVKNNIANKYQDRGTDTERYPFTDNLVVLPGSNKLKDRTCLNKLKHVKKLHDSNVYFKPHPITTYAIIGEIKDMFGEDTILPRDIDLYYFLDKADKVYTSHITESTIYAASLGKEIEPIDVYNGIERGSFYHVSKFLFENREDPIPWINQTLSSYKSGIICPNLEEDWKEKVDKYLKYICDKRDKYKNWFIDKNCKNC